MAATSNDVNERTEMATKVSVDQRVTIVLDVMHGRLTAEQVAKRMPEVSELDVEAWVRAFHRGGRRALTGWTFGRMLVFCLAYVIPSILVAFAVLLSVVTPVLDYPFDGNWPLAANKGDFWGGHLASGCAIASVFLFFMAILLQRDELREQRKELELTVEEMRQNRAIAETHLELARESAAVTQILECARLQFEAETARDTTTVRDAKVVATEHLARLDEVFDVLFSRYPLKRDLRGAMEALLGSEYGSTAPRTKVDADAGVIPDEGGSNS